MKQNELNKLGTTAFMMGLIKVDGIQSIEIGHWKPNRWYSIVIDFCRSFNFQWNLVLM